MLHVPVGAQSFGLATPSWGTTRPAAAQGTSFTPATEAYGSYAAVGSALSFDAYGILININSGYTSTTGRASCVCIGADPAGGTSYSDIIVDLLCGGADTYAAGGRAGSGAWYYFPLFIPAGTTLAVRGRATNTSTMCCAIMLFQKPMNPSMVRKGSFVETIGTHTQPNGAAITPGTTSEGAWLSLGTTARRLWWWQVGLQVASGDTSWNADAIHVDLAVGDATNKDIIILDTLVNMSSVEAMCNQPLTAGVEWDVPVGSSIYIRAQASGTLDTYNCLAYGCGG